MIYITQYIVQNNVGSSHFILMVLLYIIKSLLYILYLYYYVVYIYIYMKVKNIFTTIMFVSLPNVFN